MTDLTRRAFVQGGVAGTAAASQQPATPGPNVLFIMLDQWRFDGLGANGNSMVRTPNLDRLAERSANFTQTCCQSPVCVPSRLSFFTGRYAHSHKNRVNYTPYQQPQPKIQRLLKNAGYQTGSVGKLHFYPPTPEHARETGFDRVQLDDGVRFTESYSDYVKWRNKNDPKAGTDHYNARIRNPAPGQNPFTAVIDKQYTPTAWTGAQTRAMLREFASSTKPFFIFSSYFRPHATNIVPEPYASMYNKVEFPMPKRVGLDYIHRLPLPVQKMVLRPPAYNTPPERYQWQRRSYYADITMLDDEIGATLKELEQSGKADQTIIIVSSDHGDQMFEHGMFGKNVFFEGSVHIPLLVSWPGHIRPGTYTDLIESIDVLPSILDFCGIPIPQHVQGRSFKPLIDGNKSLYQPRSASFAENVIPEVITGRGHEFFFAPGHGVGGIRHPDAKMVRTNRWKLNYYVGHGGELYNLEDDPGEWNNLYDDPGYRSVVDELKGRLLDWMITADENDQIAPRWLL